MRLKQDIANYHVESIVGYIRKSRQDIEREKRTGEDTLSEQKALMNRILTEIELPYDLKLEIGSGENIEGRPVFQSVLEDLENGKYQAIAVKEIARMSRGNMGDAQQILDLIKNKRLVIITPYKVYDVRNPTDFRQIRFELFLAREEYEMIKERMVNARYVYAQQGKWVAGKAPYGYSYNKKTQKLMINENEAKVVRMIYDLFLNGLNGQEMSYQAIATHISKMGIKTPRERSTWSYVQVKTMLENVLYKGTIKFRTTENQKTKKIARPKSEHIVIEDAHDPIIDKDTWDKVQNKIKKKVPQPHNPLDFEPNELASVCVCGKCGAKLIRNAANRKYKKQDGTESIYTQEFLKCLRNNCMSVKYRDVEEAILDALNELSEFDEDTLKSYVTTTVDKRKNANNSNTGQQMIEQIESKEKELKSRMNFIFDKYEKGIYTDEIFLQRKTVIDQELSELEDAKKSLSLTVDKDDIDTKKLKTDIKSVVQLYQTLTEKDKKNRLLRELLESVEVELIQKGRGRIAAKFEITPLLRYDMLVKTL